MLDHLLKVEGGYTQHASDPGHQLRRSKGDKYDSYCTNFGVTQYTLSSYWGRQATMHEVKSLAVEEAREIYKYEYYKGPRINELEGELQPLVFDMSVNHGPKRAVKILQVICIKAGFALVADGKIGFKTISASNTCFQKMGSDMVNALVEERMRFYENLVKKRPSLAIFMKGWTRRAQEFIVETPNSYIASGWLSKTLAVFS